LIISFFYLLPSVSQAQNYTVKEATVLNKDFLHDFLRIGEDRYLLLNYAGPHGFFSEKRDDKTTVAVVYDKGLRQLSTVPVKDLGGKTYHGAIELHQHIQVFFSDDRHSVYKQGFDGVKCSLSDGAEELFTIPFEYQSFYKGFSADSSYSFFICKSYEKKGKDAAYNGVVMDRQFNVLTKFSFILNGVREYIAGTQYVVSPEGLLFAITAVRVKPTKSDFRPLQYIITEVSSEGKSASTMVEGLPEGLLAGVRWMPNEKGLSFVGLLAKTKKSGFTSVITGEFSSWQKKITGVKELAGENLLKGAGKDGIPADAALVGTYAMEGHAAMLILEPSQTYISSRGNFVYSDTRAGNLYVVKMDMERGVDWVKVIPNNQAEPSDPVFTGAIFMPDGKDGLYAFFHDNNRNENIEGGAKAAMALLGGGWRNLSLAAVHINGDGSFTKKYIVDDYSADHLLAPTQPFAVYHNEILYTSYDLKPAGTSNFRVGIIRVAGK
jgi:hypothetical protein